MTSSSSSVVAASPHLHITITNPSSIIPKSHHYNQPSPRSSGGGGGSGSGGTNQACAACKYQRRKCNPDCPLAPYFPADEQRRFLNAHRLFGVSNILKTLRRLKPELCAAAMHTLIYQAEARAVDPVGGCLRVILNYERELDLCTTELSTLLHHIAICRRTVAGANALPTAAAADVVTDLEVTSNQQPLLLSAPVDNTLYAAAMLNGADNHDSSPPPQHQQPQQLYDYFYYDTTNGQDKNDLDINVDVMPHFDYDSDHKVEELATVISSSSGQQQHYQIDQKEYEMKVASLVDVFDVNADIGVKEEHVDEDHDGNNNAAAAHMSDSSHCRLGLSFSSF